MIKRGPDEPRRYYGMVEDKIEATESGYSRSILLLDCIDQNRFETDDDAIDDPSALALVRTMTTERVWEDRLELANLAKGDWVAFELDDEGGAPMAWELRADDNYRRGPKRSLRKIRRLGRVGTAIAGDEPDAARVAALTTASNAARGRHRTIPLESIADRFDGDPSEAINIVIVDVGQASAALIRRGREPIALFDAGAPIWFNKGSLAPSFKPPRLGDGFIFLSHWDFDHFDLGFHRMRRCSRSGSALG